MHIYMLEIDLNGPIAAYSGEHEITGDYEGYTSAHTTMQGALASLDSWCDRHYIDRATAHHGETITNDGRFAGNDINPGLLGGDVLCWGINKYEVNE